MNGRSPFFAVCLLAGSLLAHAADAPVERPTINVKDFGAKGDCRRAMDGVMNKGSAVLTSTSAHFTGAVGGQPLYFLGVSVQRFPALGSWPGAPLRTLSSG